MRDRSPSRSHPSGVASDPTEERSGSRLKIRLGMRVGTTGLVIPVSGTPLLLSGSQPVLATMTSTPAFRNASTSWAEALSSVTRMSILSTLMVCHMVSVPILV